MKNGILLLLGAVLAVTTSAQSPQSNADLKYNTPVTKELGRVDGYLEHLPAGYNSNTKKYPLLVFLHGSGQRGNGSSDLHTIAKVGCPARRVEENAGLCFTVNGVKECFIVISPQLNTGTNWSAANQEQFWNYILNEAGYRIDRDRIYVTGHSLGGNGVWEAAYADYNEPNRFAAMAPLSYWANNSKVCTVADRKIPVWAFCGEDDGNFIKQSTAAINTLKNCPRDPSVEIKYTIVPNAGHGITGPTYRVDHSRYNPNLYEWMLSKKRGSGSSTPSTPEMPGQLNASAQSSSSIRITWNDQSSNEDGFRLQRSTSSGTGFSTIATISANKESFTDNGLNESTKYYYRVRAYNKAGNSPFTSQASATTFTDTSTPDGSPISWKDINGAVQKGDDLESIASYGWGNSGAGSTRSIPSNSDGWVEMVMQDPSKSDMVFGLSDANPNDNKESVDYGFEFSKYNNVYWIRENTDRTYIGNFNKGDRLKIERSGSKMLYKRNGKTVASTSVSSRPSLVADVALLNSGSTVFDGKISVTSTAPPPPPPPASDGYIEWVNINGAVKKGNNLESTAPYGWGNSGAGSRQSIASGADGWVEMVVQDDSKSDMVFGLSDANTNDKKESVDYGFELSRYKNSYWTRENSNRTYLGKYNQGDKLRVERSGSKILYKKNGVTVASTKITSKPVLVADVALLYTGSTVFEGKISSAGEDTPPPPAGDDYVQWTNIHRAVQKGNDLESTAPYGWGNSGAGSGQSIPSGADGWVEMVVQDDSKSDLVFGLSDVNTDDRKESVDFGFELSRYKNSYWTRENSDRTYLGKYSQGDKLRVERSGSKILYKKNGTIVATTKVSSKPSLVADVSLLNTGSTIFQARISSSSGNRTASEVNFQDPIEEEKEVLVYPNPMGAQGNLTIDLAGFDEGNEIRFLLYAIDGKLVTDMRLDNPSTSLKLEHLPKSLYTYRLLMDGRSIKSGIIKR